MKAIITVELNYPEQIYDLYETKELRLYDDKGEFFIWEGGFEIKPMPQKLDSNDWHRMFGGEYKIREAKGEGYNACIDELIGETDGGKQMKSILVIDKPIECDGCPCLNYKLWYCQADPKHRDGGEDYVPEWCPLKPMPKKLDWKVGYVREKNTCEIFNKNYVDGYNNCIDEILGEEE